MKKIILASASPRRKQLLKSIVEDFDIIVSDLEEIYPETLDPFNVSLYLSALKTYDVFKNHSDCIVIGCDTTIVMDDKVIGKPTDENDARRMLTQFSNRMHYVVSGVTVATDDKRYEINSINKVYFKNLSTNDINEYLKHDEYKDKAGSYAIQGIASKFIDHIEGEIEAIIGLPIKKLKEILDNIN